MVRRSSVSLSREGKSERATCRPKCNFLVAQPERGPHAFRAKEERRSHPRSSLRRRALGEASQSYTSLCWISHKQRLLTVRSPHRLDQLRRLREGFRMGFEGAAPASGR